MDYKAWGKSYESRSTSEEDVNIPNDMIKILYFWSPNLEIDLRKKNKEPEMESLECILDTIINDE